MTYRVGAAAPDAAEGLFIAPGASVIGDVRLGRDASVWFGAVIRGDVAPISIGAGTNVQDNAVLHVDHDEPLVVGAGVTIGHGAVLHACTIGDDVLVGMRATVLNGAVVPDRCIVGAGALVPPGKAYPPGSLLIGMPAKAVREVTPEELQALRANAARYVENARLYASDLHALH